MTDAEPRYGARYRDGYYVVVDRRTGAVVPPPAGHYKRHRDGYLWDYAAADEARRLNEGVATDESEESVMHVQADSFGIVVRLYDVLRDNPAELSLGRDSSSRVWVTVVDRDSGDVELTLTLSREELVAAVALLEVPWLSVDSPDGGVAPRLGDPVELSEVEAARRRSFPLEGSRARVELGLDDEAGAS